MTVGGGNGFSSGVIWMFLSRWVGESGTVTIDGWDLERGLDEVRVVNRRRRGGLLEGMMMRV